MSEIIQRGPITCSIACPDDFIWNYTGGVYTDKHNSTDVDHDVEVVGWGHEDGKDFWHVRNSWGKHLHRHRPLVSRANCIDTLVYLTGCCQCTASMQHGP